MLTVKPPPILKQACVVFTERRSASWRNVGALQTRTGCPWLCSNQDGPQESMNRTALDILPTSFSFLSTTKYICPCVVVNQGSIGNSQEGNIPCVPLFDSGKANQEDKVKRYLFLGVYAEWKNLVSGVGPFILALMLISTPISMFVAVSRNSLLSCQSQMSVPRLLFGSPYQGNLFDCGLFVF
jgi:hypothetical protein